MRPRSIGPGLFAAALLFSSSCASQRDGPLPTFDEYSDGVSVYTEQLLAGWKAGQVPPALFSPDLDWSGPLPAIKARQARVNVQDLAAATAQRVQAVGAGVNWLQACGYLRLVEENGDELQLARGDGVQTKELSQAQVVLQSLLQESAAYRAYFSRADARILLEQRPDSNLRDIT